MEPDDVPQGDAYRPSPYLPTKQHLQYTKEFITVLLLVIALPWILRNLIVSPQKLARALGGKAAGV
jgi:hypothetical protein